MREADRVGVDRPGKDRHPLSGVPNTARQKGAVLCNKKAADLLMGAACIAPYCRAVKPVSRITPTPRLYHRCFHAGKGNTKYPITVIFAAEFESKVRIEQDKKIKVQRELMEKLN